MYLFIYLFIYLFNEITIRKVSIFQNDLQKNYKKI